MTAATIGISTSYLLLSIPVYAAYNNHITGGIAVESKIYTLDENGNKTENLIFPENMQPVQLFDYMIEVKNLALPSYIRVKVEFESEFETNENFYYFMRIE